MIVTMICVTFVMLQEGMGKVGEEGWREWNSIIIIIIMIDYRISIYIYNR